MKNTIKIMLGLMLAATGFQAQALLIVAPTIVQCNADPACYLGPSGAPANQPSTADIEATVGVTGLFELYKQNVGGSEGGSYASSYETVFSNSSTDPEDALISYIAGSSIICPECFLLVKDGASDPNWYVFDIGSWNGTDNIDLQDFWLGQGAISNVVIFGVTTNVPEPGILALLAVGLLGFSLRNMKKSS